MEIIVCRLVRANWSRRSRSVSNPLSSNVVLVAVYAGRLVIYNGETEKNAGQVLGTLRNILDVKVGVVKLRHLLPGMRFKDIFQVVLHDCLVTLVVQAEVGQQPS